MKIICPYCATPFNDTLEKCPSCGAPNTGVRRRSGSQPITIEELKAWYASKGLPPYETTRFFIGEDYRRPRAFGIYKDEKSGSFVVYKNKDSGERAVRYEGTDEAYAVNELYQRLKQEIIQQKRAGLNAKNQGRGASRRKRRSASFSPPIGCLIGAAIPALFLLIGLIALLVQNPPKDGYYRYEQALYYHYDYIEPDDGSDWFWYDEARGEWTGPRRKDAVPEPLVKNRQAKDYYLAAALPAGWPEGEFTDSAVYQDVARGGRSNSGYYRHGEDTYYHLTQDLYSGWYYYDSARDDWYESDYYDIPYELQHSESSEDFYYTPTWDSSTQITDFADTPIYADYLDELEQERERQERRERSGWDDDDDDDDYSWDSSDSWDSGGSDWDSDW